MLASAVLYFMKSFKDSTCTERLERKSQYVQVTMPGPKAPVKTSRVQSDTADHVPTDSSPHYRILHETSRIESTERRPVTKQDSGVSMRSSGSSASRRDSTGSRRQPSTSSNPFEDDDDANNPFSESNN